MGYKTAVDSVVYNLAGDEVNRPDFLKSLIFGGVRQGADSLGNVVSKGYQNGPYFKFKRYLRWAKSDPDFAAQIGTANGELLGYQQLDLAIVKANIPPPTGQFVDHVEMARIDDANIGYWVLQHLAQNHPNDAYGTSSAYSFEYNKDAGTVTITWPDAYTETFSVVGFVSGARYLYAKYVPASPENVGPVNWELLYTTLADGVDFALDGYTFSSQTSSQFTASLGYRQKRTTTYSDGSPTTTTYTETYKQQSITQYNSIYYKDVFKGQGPGTADSVYSERQWLEADLTYVVSGWIEDDQVHKSSKVVNGVTETYTVTGEYQTFHPVRKIKNGMNEIVHKAWAYARYFIYQYQTGDLELDALFTAGSPSSLGTFFPPIPFRYANKAVGPPGSGTEEWVVDVGAFLTIGGHFIQVRGGPVKDPNVVELTITGTDPNGTSNYVYRVKNGSGYTNSLSLILTDPAVEFRILTDASISQSGVTEYTGWMPFSVPPEPYNDEALTTVYPVAKKAFRKAFGSSFNDVQESILNNPSIKDIDHALVTFGVAMNVKELACRKYIYKFFQYLMGVSPGPSSADETQWFADWQAAYDAEVTHAAWRTTHHPNGVAKTPEPPRGAFPEIPWQTLKVESVHSNVSDYRTEIKWAFMSEEIFAGEYKIGAKKDDLDFEVAADPLLNYREVDEDNPDGFNQRVILKWQDSASTWRKLTITGLQHINHVYKDLKIVITAKKALETTPEDSGFIIPLHEDIYTDNSVYLKGMSMVERTQMATACAFLVFNCYEIKKEKWYETTLFKVILIIVIIIASIVFVVVAGPASLGVGGAAVYGVATGAGLSITASLILGAIVDILVALLISMIISEISVLLFGEKWGRLIGVILTTVLFLGLGAAAGGLSFTDLLADPNTWISISLATGNGVAGYLNDTAAEIREDTAKMLEEIGEKNAEIQRLYNEQFGANRIDPTLVNRYVSELTEKPGDFLSRTLLTGSDIVELTLRSITNFADDRLRLELV